MNVDITQIISSIIAGGAVWAAIKVEIKFLWRDVNILKKKAGIGE